MMFVHDDEYDVETSPDVRFFVNCPKCSFDLWDDDMDPAGDILHCQCGARVLVLEA